MALPILPMRGRPGEIGEARLRESPANKVTSTVATAQPDDLSRALPEWNEHRRTLAVQPVSISKERHQVAFFELNGQ